MQHAGLHYGQGAVNSHHSPTFPHAEISQINGGTTTSSLRQFRKKEGEKSSSTDLNTVENSQIARVPPHNHYPARPNEYLRYQHQYPDYNAPYKETPAPVKYSEIAETPPQHVDHLPTALQKHKEAPKDLMDMCNISQQTHMKQNYADNLTRQQSYPPDAHQYLHKEPQVHSGYKPESQYQQYPQIPKYNMPSQCRKYPPPPENDFLAKLQRINPTMARSIMSDHHIRESQSTYPSMDQNRMYPQNHQRYYPPAHIQNYNYQPPYNYPASCNYPRSNQMGVGGAQYPALNPHSDRSLSPRNLHMMNYGTSPQKISPNYPQYNAPEYAQHYQHRRTALPQEYYQQSCRANPYMGGHQISPEPADNRGSSGAIRHFLENWAEEEGNAEITPIFKENIRIHNNETTNDQQVIVINPSELPQCLENVSLVPTENGQYILKTAALDNSVVRIKETTESDGEKTVNLQILETGSKPDCMLAESPKTEETPTVPYQETAKVCDETTKSEEPQPNEETGTETSVIVSNEVSVIKDMPLIEEGCEEKQTEEIEQPNEDTTETTPKEKVLEETPITSTTKRTQRIFSVDDIMNNIGSSPTETRRNSLQFVPTDEPNEPHGDSEEPEYRNAISVEDDSVILEIGGAWVQLNINHHNGTKVLSVLPLSDSLVIDVNANYQESRELEESVDDENEQESIDDAKAEKNVEEAHDNEKEEESVEEARDGKEREEVVVPVSPEEELASEPKEEVLEEINASVYQSEVVIGEDSVDNEVFLDMTVEAVSPLVENAEQKEKETVEVVDTTEVEEQPDVTEVSIERSPEIAVEVAPPKEEESRHKHIDTDEMPVEIAPEVPIEIEAPKEEEPKYKIFETDRKRDDRVKFIDTDEMVVEMAPEVTVEIEPPKEEEPRHKKVEADRKRERKYRNPDERKKSSSKRVRSDERKDSEERPKVKKAKLGDSDRHPLKKSKSDHQRFEPELKSTDEGKKKVSKKLTPQSSIEDEPEVKKTQHKKKDNDQGVKKDKKREYTEVKKSATEEDIPETVNLKRPEKREDKPKIKKPEKIEGEERTKPDLEEPPEEAMKIENITKVEEIEKKEVTVVTTDEPKRVDDVVQLAEEMITLHQLAETKDGEKIPTKAAKKLYTDYAVKDEPKKSKLEETVIKIKSLKEKNDDRIRRTSMRDVVEKTKKILKKVTFNLENDIREINKEDMDRRKLSLQEYNSRKRKPTHEELKHKIMENTVTSTEDEPEKESPLNVHNPPRKPPSNWEDDTPSPGSPKDEVMSTTTRKCIIDVNEFNIKPIESVSTPSPVSSSQFSYHSEDDSLQVYKDVVDSKLNSLNITIPKLSKPKPVDRFAVLLDRFLNKGTLNYEELEEVKKFIEIKRKMMEDEKKLTYEVKGERDYKDLKLHFRKVPEKRKKKRFRNLYTGDSSDDSDSSRSDKGVENYSVYQRDSQGVPKLIFKRKSGLPQPFVKLERSQAVDLMAKKKKLY